VLYQLAAEAILILHLSFGIFAVLGWVPLAEFDWFSTIIDPEG